MIVFVILLTGSRRSTTRPFSTAATVTAAVVEDSNNRVSRDLGIMTSRATRSGEEGEEDIVEDGDMVEEATVAVGTRRRSEFVAVSDITLCYYFCFVAQNFVDLFIHIGILRTILVL